MLANDLRFEELRKVLESYGYTMKSPRGGSSHSTFRKPGCMPIMIPSTNPSGRLMYTRFQKDLETEADDCDIYGIQSKIRNGLL